MIGRKLPPPIGWLKTMTAFDATSRGRIAIASTKTCPTSPP